MTRLLNTSYSYIKKTEDTELDTSCSRVIFNDESIYTVFISIKVIRVTKIKSWAKLIPYIQNLLYWIYIKDG